MLSLLPTVIQGLLQQNFLERELEEGLDSILAYRGLVVEETFPGRIGETLTRTRKGRRTPITTPMNPANNSGLDNGLSSSNGTFSIEQYTFKLAEYADTTDLNLMAEQGEIVRQFLANARNLAVQAAQSLERICRQKLFNAYLGGNSRTIADPGGTITSNTPGALPATITNTNVGNVHLDDIRGFQTQMVAGVPTALSVSNALPVVVTKAAGTVITGLTIELSTAFLYQVAHTVAEVTTTPDAIPGFVALRNNSGGTYTIAVGDAIVAANSPLVLRPFGRRCTTDVKATDVLTMGILSDATAYMRDNGIPPMDDGTFHILLDNTSMRQLWADPDFKSMVQGRGASDNTFRDMDVMTLMGMTFIPTTETYVHQISGNAFKIRRPIIVGAESIIQGNFEGMETWLAESGIDAAQVAMVDGIVQIIREPLDRLKQIVAQSWTWIGDFAVPTDLTATASIIPTASAAAYKRAVVIEHAG